MIFSGVEAPAVTPMASLFLNHSGFSSLAVSMCFVSVIFEQIWARRFVLALWWPPITIIMSEFFANSLASCWRSFVAEQIVL